MIKKSRTYNLTQSIIFALFVSTIAACQPTASLQNAPSAQTDIVKAVTNHQAILLDVRTESEYASGHVAQAVLIPHDQIEQKIASIAPNKEQTIYLYCRSGRRSGIASEALKSLGYKNVVDLGGLGQLQQYGLSIQP